MRFEFPLSWRLLARRAPIEPARHAETMHRAPGSGQRSRTWCIWIAAADSTSPPAAGVIKRRNSGAWMAAWPVLVPGTQGPGVSWHRPACSMGKVVPFLERVQRLQLDTELPFWIGAPRPQNRDARWVCACEVQLVAEGGDPALWAALCHALCAHGADLVARQPAQCARRQRMLRLGPAAIEGRGGEGGRWVQRWTPSPSLRNETWTGAV